MKCTLTCYCREIGDSELLLADTEAPFDLLGEFLWAGIGRSTTVSKMHRDGMDAVLKGREHRHQITGDSFTVAITRDTIEINDIYDGARFLSLKTDSFVKALDAWESAVDKFRDTEQRAHTFPIDITLDIEAELE